ncbi:MAG: ComEC/Rec2 family competence protein, partial [Leeuwenhoekiella sp.]
LRSALIVLGIWMFAFLAGLSPSVMRAATMFTFIQVGIATRRKGGGMNGLISSAFILLLIEPKLLFQVGFQLSYMAVFFILWLQPILYNLWDPSNKVLKYFWGILTVTLVAQLGVLPLSLFYFHQFSSLFFLSNLFVIPLLGVVIALGILVMTLAALSILPSPIANLYSIVVGTLNDFIFWVASFDTFIAKDIYFSVGLLILGYAVIISLGRLTERFSFSKIMVALSSILLLVFYNLYDKNLRKQDHYYIHHNYKGSLISQQYDRTLRILADANDYEQTISLFQQNINLETIEKKTIENYHIINGKELLVIDSLGIYEVANANPEYILLRDSPKINLNRLLQTYSSAMIIADGSNYKNYVNRWKASCRDQKIPFHSTYEKGAFEIE